MRKVLTLITLAIFMASCSSDDTTPAVNPEKIVFLKKVIQTEENGDTSTQTYKYDGDKIVNMNSTDGSSIVYTYTGDLITHIKSQYTSNNSTIETILEYNSNNQKISEIQLITAPRFEQGERTTYIYNQDGTVTFENYVGDLESQTQFIGTGTITFNESENTIIRYGLFPDGSSQELYRHTFDTKNNPMKNIRGYSEYLSPNFDRNNNALTAYTTSIGSTFIYTYTYNSDNYPITSKTEVYGDFYTTYKKQFFYE